MAPNGNGHSDNFQMQEWKDFYLKSWDIDVVIGELLIPKNKKEGFDQLIIMLRGLTLPKIVSKMREHMEVRLWENEDWLDEIDSDREIYKQDYAVRIRGEKEADKEFASKSAIDLGQEKICGITLPEQLIYTLFYWWKFQDHLDMEGVTLCSGSRHLDMRKVPWVLWDCNRKRLVVFW